MLIGIQDAAYKGIRAFVDNPKHPRYIFCFGIGRDDNLLGFDLRITGQTGKGVGMGRKETSVERQKPLGKIGQVGTSVSWESLKKFKAAAEFAEGMARHTSFGRIISFSASSHAEQSPVLPIPEKLQQIVIQFQRFYKMSGLYVVS